MPLTLELYGSDSQQKGHLMIDRNNLIITYYADSSITSERKASSNRNRLAILIEDAALDLDLVKEKNFAMSEDPRHEALEHVSSDYEKNQCLHAHVILKTDISFGIIKTIFSSLNIGSFSDILSKDCVNYILYTSAQYFSQLENSAIANQIEADYQNEKQNEFEKATREAMRLGFDNTDHDDNDDKNENNLKFFTSSFVLWTSDQSESDSDFENSLISESDSDLENSSIYKNIIAFKNNKRQ